ncbi:hypothetical protein Sste5346_002293 [Sporothrix stenoceras]|uniref:Tetraspanin tsp3 n=1 Tax=Sporothrix stenoceras TaxID=5173 RepID=A0ABR3ZKK1_9PEZI
MATWSWIYVYPVLLVILFGVAIYEHVFTTSLSLPLSPVLTVLAIVLPVLSFANTIALPAALTATDNNDSLTLVLTRRRPLLVASLLQGFHLIQLLLAIILAVFFFERTAPSSIRSCLLGTAWQHLFATKNAAALRRIQDALDCCGFNSVRDRAWPFAEHVGRGGGVACAERFGRTQACAAPWTAALQRTAGIEGGIAAAVFLLQVALYFAAPWVNAQQQRRQQNRPQQQRESGWARLFLPFVAGGVRGEETDGSQRPLLGSGNDNNGRGYVYEENDNADEQPNGQEGNTEGNENAQNGDIVDEEQARPGEQEGQQSTGQYGTIAPHDAWRAD